MNCACWDAQPKGEEFYAWAVRSGDVVAVPEPSTLALLGGGLHQVDQQPGVVELAVVIQHAAAQPPRVNRG